MRISIANDMFNIMQIGQDYSVKLFFDDSLRIVSSKWT